MSNAAKLVELVAATGHHSLLTFLQDYIDDPMVPGICCNEQRPTCNFIADVKSSENGYCDNCKKRTVLSCLKLANLV